LLPFIPSPRFPQLNLFVLAFSCVLLAACAKKGAQQQVKITVDSHETGGKKVQIFTTSLVNYEDIELFASMADSAGKSTLEFELPHALFAQIKSGSLTVPLYLTPGDQLNIFIDSTGVRFAGDGAKINEYLRQTAAIRRRYDWHNGVPALTLGAQKFLSIRDSIQQATDVLLEKLIVESNPGRDVQTILRARNKMNLLLLQQNYAFMHYGTDTSNPDLPVSIREAITDIPFDTLALKTNLYEYGMAMPGYLQSEIYASLYDDHQALDSDSLARTFPILADKKIREGKYPRQLKELLLAKNIVYCLDMDGITPALEAAYNQFKSESNNKEYVSIVQVCYDKWLALSPGKPAPDFTGITPDGKKLSLHDLSGKVVYMDVWATWCTPCKEEFAHSRKLERQFAGNDRVAFLFISIDEDLPAWRKLLSQGYAPEGIHINQKQDKQPDAVWEAYRISGIPRYMLIDAEGRIVQAQASRPSSGQVPALISKLLLSPKPAVL
jgi:thiol-disulfide isomerase/thioredoxin